MADDFPVCCFTFFNGEPELELLFLAAEEFLISKLRNAVLQIVTNQYPDELGSYCRELAVARRCQWTARGATGVMM